MGERIHWGVFNALKDAADSFIKEEQENIEFLKERLHFADAEGNNAVHLEKNIESAVQRVDEVEKFKEGLTDAELQGDVEGLLDDNVRTWLLLGLNQLSDTSKWSKEFISSEEWRLDNVLTPDEQLFMFQAYRLLRRLTNMLPDTKLGKQDDIHTEHIESQQTRREKIWEEFFLAIADFDTRVRGFAHGRDKFFHYNDDLLTRELAGKYLPVYKDALGYKSWTNPKRGNGLSVLEDALIKYMGNDFSKIDALERAVSFHQNLELKEWFEDVCIRARQNGKKEYQMDENQQTKEPQVDRKSAEPITWKGQQEGLLKLKELAGELHKQGLINSSEWFVERFGSDCPPDKEGWEGADNMLVYLLEQLQARKKFVPVSQSRLENVFRVKHYKQKKYGYEKNNSRKPRVADKIDRILSNVFPDL